MFLHVAVACAGLATSVLAGSLAPRPSSLLHPYNNNVGKLLGECIIIKGVGKEEGEEGLGTGLTQALRLIIIAL